MADVMEKPQYPASSVSDRMIVGSDQQFAFEESIIEGRDAWMILQAKAPFQVTQVSSCWCELSGYKEDAVIGRSLKFLEGPGTNQAAIRRLLHSAKDGHKDRATVVIYQNGCHPLLTFLEAKPVLDENGDVLRIFLQTSSSDTATMKEAIEDDGAWILLSNSSKLTITESSPKLHDITGFTKGSLTSRSCRVLLGPASNESSLHDALNDCQTGKGVPGGFLLTIYSSQGRPIVCIVHIFAVMDSRAAVTHMKIRLEVAQLTTLEEAMQPTGNAKFIVFAKQPHRISFVSDEWCGMYNLPKDAAIASSVDVVQGQCTDSEALLSALARSSLSALPQEVRLITYRGGGDPLATCVCLVPLLSSNGQVDHILGRVTLAHNGGPDADDCNTAAASGGEGQLDTEVGRLPSTGVYASDCGLESEMSALSEYPCTPEGRITHLNGCTHLVLFPREDPTLTHCLRYIRHLRDTGVVRGWRWQRDALHVHVDTNRVLEYTRSSRWCRQWAPDLRTWHAWWNRMLWVVSRASMGHAHPATAAAAAAPRPDCELSAAVVTGGSSGSEDEGSEMGYGRGDAASDLGFLAEAPPRGSWCEVRPQAQPRGRAFVACLGAGARLVPPRTKAGRRGDRAPTAAAVPRCAIGEVDRLEGLAAELDRLGVDSPVCLVGGGGAVVFANAAMEEQAGVGAGALVGLAWREVVCPGGGGGGGGGSGWAAICAALDGGGGAEPAVAAARGRGLGGSVFAAHARAERCGDGLVALSLVECGDLFEPLLVLPASRGGAVEAEEVDSGKGDGDGDGSLGEAELIRECECDELRLLQEHALLRLRDAVQHFVAPAPSPATARGIGGRFTELLVPLDPAGGELLRECGKMLWRLRGLGLVRAWHWECDSLSVSADLNVLTPPSGGVGGEGAAVTAMPSWDAQSIGGGVRGSARRLAQLISLLDCSRRAEAGHNSAPASVASTFATDFRFLLGSGKPTPPQPAENEQAIGNLAEAAASESGKKAPLVAAVVVAKRAAVVQQVQKAETCDPSESPPEKAAIEGPREASVREASAEATALDIEFREAERKLAAGGDSVPRAPASPAPPVDACAGPRARGAAAVERPAVSPATASAERAVAALLDGHARLGGCANALEGRLEELEQEARVLRSAAAAAAKPRAAAPQLRPAARLGGGFLPRAGEPHGGWDDMLADGLVGDFARWVEGARGEAGLGLLDQRGVLLWASAPLLAAVGFPAEEVAGCRWTSFLCGPETDRADLGRLEAAFADGSAGGDVSACLRCYHERGHPVWLQLTQRPLAAAHGGGAPLFLLACADASPLLRRVLALGRPMDNRRDPELAREARGLSASLARTLDIGEAALAAAQSRRRWTAATPVTVRTTTAASAAVRTASIPRTMPPPPGAPRGAEALVSAREPWVVLEVSAAWERLFEFPAHEVRGRSVAAVLGAGAWPAFSAAAAAATTAKCGSDHRGGAVAMVGVTRSGLRVALEVEVVAMAAAGGKADDVDGPAVAPLRVRFVPSQPAA